MGGWHLPSRTAKIEISFKLSWGAVPRETTTQSKTLASRKQFKRRENRTRQNARRGKGKPLEIRVECLAWSTVKISRMFRSSDVMFPSPPLSSLSPENPIGSRRSQSCQAVCSHTASIRNFWSPSAQCPGDGSGVEVQWQETTKINICMYWKRHKHKNLCVVVPDSTNRVNRIGVWKQPKKIHFIDMKWIKRHWGVRFSKSFSRVLTSVVNQNFLVHWREVYTEPHELMRDLCETEGKCSTTWTLFYELILLPIFVA